MSHKSTYLAGALICGLMLLVAGCAMPAIEGLKAGHVASAGDYEETTPAARQALTKYKGYKLGKLSWQPVSVPADTEEDDLEDAQEQVDHELKVAKEVVALLPDRFAEYMVDDAGLQLNAKPAIVVSVVDVRVKQRTGFVGVAMPKAEVEAIVTLTDAETGEVIGTAKVSDHTTSRVLGDGRQMANFICRGTAKWIRENCEAPDKD